MGRILWESFLCILFQANGIMIAPCRYQKDDTCIIYLFIIIHAYTDIFIDVIIIFEPLPQGATLQIFRVGQHSYPNVSGTNTRLIASQISGFPKISYIYNIVYRFWCECMVIFCIFRSTHVVS